MNEQQKSAHYSHVRTCLVNRRASVISELSQQRASAERSRAKRGIDPVYGSVDIERRAVQRVKELLSELEEIDGRLETGV